MKRPDIPTVQHPTKPDKFYFRLNFHEFFFGPFDTLSDVSKALAALDAWNNMWDYDRFAVIRGLFPLPQDYVYGFPFVSKEERDEIQSERERLRGNEL